jgi:hypothetical protein
MYLQMRNPYKFKLENLKGREFYRPRYGWEDNRPMLKRMFRKYDVKLGDGSLYFSLRAENTGRPLINVVIYFSTKCVIFRMS